MAILPLQLARVSDLLQSGVATQSISGTQAQLLTLENEISSGKKVNQPSDDPSAAGLILSLQKTLAQRQAYAKNIATATTQLSTVDSSLNTLSDLLLQAKNIGSADVGSATTSQQRQGDAQVVNSLITEAQGLANTQSNGVYLFGGDKSTTQPYINAAGGIQFVGSTTVTQTNVDQNVLAPTTISGPSVFGGLSPRLVGATSLNPAATLGTQLSDLNGAKSAGINRGTIQLGNGTISSKIDLSNAQTLGDVVSAINTAAVGGISASLTSTGITLAGGPTDNITVTDISSTAAADLGILSPPGGAGAGTPLIGSALNPRITPLTPLSTLNNGAGLDPAGITISNGAATKTITFAPGGTVESLLNAVNGAGLGVSAQINSTNSGINVLNATQGTTLTIGENGGSTATQLGIRSYTPATTLADLNNGAGVGVAPAGSTGDFAITGTAGATFNVSIAGAKTVQDVINSINAAATAAGASLTASFATTGNGIVLTDGAGGAGTLSLQSLNGSTAAADLGLTTPASGNKINGADVNGVQTPGVFTDLTALAKALTTGNQAAITAAASNLQTDYANATAARGLAGAQSQNLQNRKSDLDTQNVATEKLLSDTQDTDLTAAVSQLQTLQTALQASLLTTSKTQSLTLLNFLG